MYMEFVRLCFWLPLARNTHLKERLLVVLLAMGGVYFTREYNIKMYCLFPCRRLRRITVSTEMKYIIQLASKLKFCRM